MFPHNINGAVFIFQIIFGKVFSQNKNHQHLKTAEKYHNVENTIKDSNFMVEKELLYQSKSSKEEREQ